MTRETFKSIISDENIKMLGRISSSDRSMAEQIKEYDPHLARLVLIECDARDEMIMYLTRRAEL